MKIAVPFLTKCPLRLLPCNVFCPFSAFLVCPFPRLIVSFMLLFYLSSLFFLFFVIDPEHLTEVSLSSNYFLLPLMLLLPRLHRLSPSRGCLVSPWSEILQISYLIWAPNCSSLGNLRISCRCQRRSIQICSHRFPRFYFPSSSILFPRSSNLTPGWSSPSPGGVLRFF